MLTFLDYLNMGGWALFYISIGLLMIGSIGSASVNRTCDNILTSSAKSSPFYMLIVASAPRPYLMGGLYLMPVGLFAMLIGRVLQRRSSQKKARKSEEGQQSTTPYSEHPTRSHQR